MSEPGFGVYVHWPFCAAKCPYCDFNSHVRHKPVDQKRFARALATEIAHVAATSDRAEVTSVFFGGGTPSLMEPATVAKVLDAIAAHWRVAGDAEVTLEANPTSIEASNFAGYRSAGVNRVSMGVQSLDDRQLKFLGRLHSADEARRAIGVARDHFDRMSFDMIYARPDQTIADWERELREAIALAADHLSLYQLTIEPGTPFFGLAERGKIVVPDPELAATLYEATQAITADAGLPLYEVSNHARRGAESRHNLTYWRYGAYAGIGPGAHGRVFRNGRRFATRAEANPERWAGLVETRGHGHVEDTLLDPTEEASELLVMGLRLREGIDLARHARLAGERLDDANIDALVGDGLLERLGADGLRATPEGMLVLNGLLAAL